MREHWSIGSRKNGSDPEFANALFVGGQLYVVYASYAFADVIGSSDTSDGDAVLSLDSLIRRVVLEGREANST